MEKRVQASDFVSSSRNGHPVPLKLSLSLKPIFKGLELNFCSVDIVVVILTAGQEAELRKKTDDSLEGMDSAILFKKKLTRARGDSWQGTKEHRPTLNPHPPPLEFTKGSRGVLCGLELPAKFSRTREVLRMGFLLKSLAREETRFLKIFE